MSPQQFFGKGSSEFAKSRYKPIQHSAAEQNLVLGTNTSAVILSDAKLFGFTAAKHKFVGKMFEGYSKVLEIGCMDGYGSLVVGSFVRSLIAIDFYAGHIQQAQAHILPHCTNVEFLGHDFLDGAVGDDFDGCFALDVLEHIDPEQEDQFMRNVVASLRPNGVFIVGMPSLESQIYASPENKFAHINCKTASALKNLMERYFENVFAFGMNDEVLHTGYSKMCHYLINVCAGPKVSRGE